jgi:hypothetical protein
MKLNCFPLCLHYIVFTSCLNFWHNPSYNLINLQCHYLILISSSLTATSNALLNFFMFSRSISHSFNFVSSIRRTKSQSFCSVSVVMKAILFSVNSDDASLPLLILLLITSAIVSIARFLCN